jgi:Rrf2 family transcriptional regulator, iron-sulfur cluster assembly transcription factor
MLLSKSCEYGIRATLHLARLKSAGYVSIRDISDDLDISFHFLTKIFQKLTLAGILASFRGPNGGVALARPARDISLLDLVTAIDGQGLFHECILGLPGCGNRTPCPLHASWAVERSRLKSMFESMTLAATAEELETLGLRLSAGITT